MTMLNNMRKTTNDKLGGVLRILLGTVFFLAGLLKIVVPTLGEAFSGQLLAAHIPFRGLVLFTFPIVEMLIGILLLVGLHARVTAALAGLSMIVATYVHVTVENPALFPLQPVEPVGPLVLLILLLYTLLRGAGAWSFDLKETASR